MKISGSPGGRLPGRIPADRSRGAGKCGRIEAEAEEERFPAAAHVDARDGGDAGNHFAVRQLVGDGLAVDLEDQVTIAYAGTERDTAEIHADHANATSGVRVPG